VRLILLILITFLSRGALAQGVPEHEMKAAYLYNFAVYTEWPTPSDSLNMCVLGQSPVAAALKALDGKITKNRRVTVATLTSLSTIKRCHVLFISERDIANMRQISGELGDSPVLTVTDVPGIPGIVITLQVINQRLVFDVNLPLARTLNLSLSSEFLRLARSTR
jgi:hypothetical protein